MSKHVNRAESEAQSAFCVLSIGQLKRIIELARAQRQLVGGEEMGDAECVILEGDGRSKESLGRVEFHFSPETVRSPYLLKGERF